MDSGTDPADTAAPTNLSSKLDALGRHPRPGDEVAPHLLPLEERLNYFQGRLLDHRNLNQMYAELMNAIAYPGDRLMVYVYGPTRAGKTTLLNQVVSAYEAKSLEARMRGTWNPGHIPILRVAVPATGEKAVPFREIYLRILDAAQEPLIDQKRVPGTMRAWKPRSSVRPASAGDLRWAVESMLRNRRPAAILLDEAQHLALRRSAEALEAQLDCLKSLAEATGIVYVLAGSYDLLSFRDNNAQLSSRSRYLHFSRYRLENVSDVEEFRKIVRSFGRRLPFEFRVKLEQHWQLLYQHSAGIVGVVKTWLYEALKLALFEGASTLTAEHLQRSTYDLSQVFAIAQQAIEGETTLARAMVIPASISAELGFSSALTPPDPSLYDAASAHGATEESALDGETSKGGRTAPGRSAKSNQHAQTASATNAPSQSTPKSRGRKRVGERKPVRDPIGREKTVPGEGKYRI